MTDFLHRAVLLLAGRCEGLPDRFMALVEPEPTSGCWIWIGSRTGGGYGTYWDGTRSVGAHRFAFEAYHGPLGSGLEPDHLCRLRCCVNALHMEAVTHQVNNARGVGSAFMLNAAKTQCPRRHPYDAGNTRRYQGRRFCRLCDRDRHRRGR